MPEVFANGSVFKMEQLTGEKRQVNLINRALPYRPFGLKTMQRVEITWLPGNPVGTATVLGPQEDPTTINGMWKDKYLGDTETVNAVTGAPASPGVATAPFIVDGAPVTSCREAVKVMDAICREGQLLQVTWDQETRHGFLVEFDKNYQNVHDLEWSMRFAWIGRGEPEVPAVFTQEADLSSLTSTLTQDFDVASIKFGAPGFPFNQSAYNALIGLLGAISAYVGIVQSSVNNLGALALGPVNAICNAIAACSGLVFSCDTMALSLTSVVPGAYDISTPLYAQTASQRLVSSIWVRDMTDSLAMLKYDAVEQRNVLLTLSQTDILAVYTARDGDDLRDVSRRFYGTVNDWIPIMQFNGLPSSALVRGQIVLLPRDPYQETLTI